MRCGIVGMGLAPSRPVGRSPPRLHTSRRELSTGYRRQRTVLRKSLTCTMSILLTHYQNMRYILSLGLFRRFSAPLITHSRIAPLQEPTAIEPGCFNRNDDSAHAPPS